MDSAAPLYELEQKYIERPDLFDPAPKCRDSHRGKAPRSHPLLNARGHFPCES